MAANLSHLLETMHGTNVFPRTLLIFRFSKFYSIVLVEAPIGGKSPPPGLDQTIKGCVNMHPGLLKECEKFLVQKSDPGMGF